MTVKDVLALGNQVKIVHLRPVQTGFRYRDPATNQLSEPYWHSEAQSDIGIYSRKEMFAKYGKYAVPANKGGQTLVKVTTPTGQVLVGIAACSDKDNFNKKLGVNIALGRALTSGE